MALFDFLQFEALLIGEIYSHLPMRFRHDLMDAPACVSSYLFQLGGRLIDDRRCFGDLVRRQVELRAEPFLHSNGDQFGMMKFEEKMPGVQSSKESAGDSPGDEHEDK